MGDNFIHSGRLRQDTSVLDSDWLDSGTIEGLTGAATVIGIALIHLAILSSRRKARKLRLKALLEDRPPLSDNEFYSKFYSHSPIPRKIVLKLRHRFASAAKVPLKFTRPFDCIVRFGATGLLSPHAQRAAPIETLDDLIRVEYEHRQLFDPATLHN